MARIKGSVSIDSNFQSIVNKNIFIDNAIEDELVEVETKKKLSNGYAGEIKKILQVSPHRVTPICPVYEKCGGCQMLHRNYESQLALKKMVIQNAAKKINVMVKEVIGCDNPYFYRNKLIASFGKQNGKTICGLYSTFSHQLVEVKKCYLHDELGDEIIQKVLVIVNKLRIPIYQEDKKTGLLRHIIVRRATKLDQTMITLVFSKKEMKTINLLKNEILKAMRVDTIVANINARSTSIILGEEEVVLFGKGYIQDELMGFKFNISSKSFYQINHIQTEKLYANAIELAKLNPNDTVLDAYSGIGSIGISLSKKVKHVLCVELNKDACNDAKINVKINNLNNISIVNEDATKYIQFLAKTKKRIDVVVMDPTRSGSTEAFMGSCRNLNVKKVVYISCNPLTQIRDIAYFQKLGYQCSEMHLVDLFANTNHVESIVVLTRK